MMASPDIDIVLNLTIPKAHAKVSLMAIEHKKHVYSEKPLAISFEDGRSVLETAHQNNVIVGSTPDTFLGGSIQLAGRLIKDGVIGKPIGATAFMMSRGPESWHPNPEFFYQAGGGPMFDISILPNRTYQPYGSCKSDYWISKNYFPRALHHQS